MVEAVGIDTVTLLSILALAWTFGLVAQRLGYPALMGELVAGIVFGPTILGVLQPAAELEIFAELGVFLLMVYVGLEVAVEVSSDVLERARLASLALLSAHRQVFEGLLGETDRWVDPVSERVADRL